MSEHIGNGMNYLCPKCKCGDNLRVVAQIWVALVPDGTEHEGGDEEWDDESAALCRGCGWRGKVGDFIVLPDGEGKMYECADCGMEFHENQGNDVKDAHERFLPGDLYTDLECPSCGALAFPIK